MERLEAILSSLSIFERLRKDEIGRIAPLFQAVRLGAGETFRCGGTAADARMVVVVHGKGRLDVAASLGTLASTVEAGDRFGDIGFQEQTREVTLTSKGQVELATLDTAGLDALLATYPAIALPLAAEMASELGRRTICFASSWRFTPRTSRRGSSTAAVDERGAPSPAEARASRACRRARCSGASSSTAEPSPRSGC